MSSEVGGTAPGLLAWMANNAVAANLLMFVLIGGGLVVGTQVKKEVFPHFDLGAVTVEVAYPGAGPAEVEQGVILAIEEAVNGLDGVRRVSSTAREGSGAVIVNLLNNANSGQALADIKAAVDRIQTFPGEVERPVIRLVSNRNQVISLVIYGDIDEHSLRRLAEQARETLLVDERISQVELDAVRAPEISIEVSQETLRAYGLTHDAIAAAVGRASVEIPGGSIKTPGGEILLRTSKRRHLGSDFADIVVLSRPDGSEVKLSAIANIVDSFRETDEEAWFNGKRAAMVTVYRVGDQTPVEIAAVVRDYAEARRASLPPGVGIATWADRSAMYSDRVDLLLRNGAMGLVLVLLALGIFLEARLAFWVTVGIPISFLGALFLMPSLGVSINMITLFAFIVTIGVVVDDAIVVGDSVYEHRQKGKNFMQAAIDGVREVAAPVTYSVVTTVVAFLPLLFVPGVAGKFFRGIPLVVVAVLLVSLFESLFILPAHLAHSKKPSTSGLLGLVNRGQRRCAFYLKIFIRRTYRPFLDQALEHRYLTIATAISLMVFFVGMVAGGRVKFAFLPKIESDRVVATVYLPYGTAVDETRAASKRLVAGAQTVLNAVGQQVNRGLFVQVGGTAGGFGGPDGDHTESGGHITQAVIYLVASDQRDVRAAEVAERWRQAVGDIAGAERVTFQYDIGPGGGAPIDIELSHPRIAVLEKAASRLADELRSFAGTRDVDDGFSLGKAQIDFQLRPEARSLGITEADLGRQVRSAFFGAEALRQQRGRDELRVYVRLPPHQRQSEYDVERLLIRTRDGGEIPLGQAATVVRSRAYTKIERADGRRTVNVSADINRGANANDIVDAVVANVMPQLQAEFPDLRFGFGGQQKEQRDIFGSLGIGFLVALIIIFGLLAVAFRSYLQPLIVMIAIPFGFIGAIIGHLILGYDLSLVSMMGVVALSGVVVNDSLVLIMAANDFTSGGMAVGRAVCRAAMRRFRPIFLTSVTTFCGLMPMLLETSEDSRFLIPMAISLAFGVMFATLITLLLVPAIYLVVADFRGQLSGSSQAEAHAHASRRRQQGSRA